MKLLIIGNARHGKDTLADIFSNFGLKFQSSSQAALQIFLFDALKDKYGYADYLECFNDRVNHRKEWKDLIKEYNRDDKTKLCKEILKYSDCYVGLRDKEELEECIRQNIFSLIIWVDASKRLPQEDKTSIDISSEYADIIIENNGTYEEFCRKATKLGNLIFGRY